MTRAGTPRRAGADLVAQLFSAAFDKPRDPRSTEYKAGVRALLVLRVHGLDIIRPYPMGTAQADAFYSGVDEGNIIWREHKRAQTARGAAPSASTPDGA
jgi:hypothetical protein